jgi:hypothetical protein
MLLDKNLIISFRNLVNSNSYYILHKYRNQEGKNRWNIICSAMDWITVSIDNYNSYAFESPKKDLNKYCMDVYNFISIIDIITESVNQLHRVLTGSINPPFKEEKIIFTNNDQKDDSEYFKHIRAIFGAHPVNLNKNNERWYASWPFKGHFNNYDLEVFLYPLSSTMDTMRIGIYLEELKKFAERRYNYLIDLESLIKEDYDLYIGKCQKREINFSSNGIDDAILLKIEHNNRLPNDYIDMMIDDVIKYLGVDITNSTNTEIYLDFMHKVKTVLEDLKDAVQTMDYRERASYSYLDYDIPANYTYAFSKYVEYLEGKYDPLAEYFFSEIKELLKNIVELDWNMSNDEQKLLIVAGLQKLEG